MNRNPETGAKLFVGTEVEHTPAYGKTTLFVVGVQDVQDIEDSVTELKTRETDATVVEHIYFGANMSFPKLEVDDAAGWAPWEDMVRYFLDQGFLCTLDIDVACTEGLLESGLTEYHNFIPMISVKLPYIDQLGYNATVKLDDRGFRATNPGVWCHSLHELKDRRVFTDWSKYTKDLEL